ncbi:hypothetical protein G6O67_007793 [Ophiocordyceps sinensis]|uniref:Uncharacterized protein n=1 Tax=Ophiocordyceps sinensis TaxID=72228 RepID=A0A8H4LUP0_9HYPO|nr:hypothetical protein G6O67_007793 [Ophiocordyceps sinensis]
MKNLELVTSVMAAWACLVRGAPAGKPEAGSRGRSPVGTSGPAPGAVSYGVSGSPFSNSTQAAVPSSSSPVPSSAATAGKSAPAAKGQPQPRYEKEFNGGGVLGPINSAMGVGHAIAGPAGKILSAVAGHAGLALGAGPAGDILSAVAGPVGHVLGAGTAMAGPAGNILSAVTGPAGHVLGAGVGAAQGAVDVVFKAAGDAINLVPDAAGRALKGNLAGAGMGAVSDAAKLATGIPMDIVKIPIDAAGTLLNGRDVSQTEEAKSSYSHSNARRGVVDAGIDAAAGETINLTGAMGNTNTAKAYA